MSPGWDRPEIRGRIEEGAVAQLPVGLKVGFRRDDDC